MKKMVWRFADQSWSRMRRGLCSWTSAEGPQGCRGSVSPHFLVPKHLGEERSWRWVLFLCSLPVIPVLLLEAPLLILNRRDLGRMESSENCGWAPISRWSQGKNLQDQENNDGGRGSPTCPVNKGAFFILKWLRLHTTQGWPRAVESSQEHSLLPDLVVTA